MARFAAAITGAGLVTPAGVGIADNWARVLAAAGTAASHVKLPGVGEAPACQVQGFEPKEHGLRGAWQFDRYTQFALVAVDEALRMAGLEPRKWRDASRVAVVVGSGAGGTATLEEQHATLLATGAEAISPLTLPMGLVNMAAGQVAIAIGATGPCQAPCTACASGVTAICVGRDLLRTGAADIVVAAGAEAPVTPLYMAAFGRMGTLSKNPDPAAASRPFDTARDGFVLGEGAGAVVLESAEHAAGRGAAPIAHVVGQGQSADAYHVTRPHKEGAGAATAMRAALADAGVQARDTQYVNAHGTSTRLNDSTEGKALHRLFGADVLVSSTKGVTGHLLGAGGAIETIYTALALRHGAVPPTANLGDPDPEVEVDLVAGEPRAFEPRLALTNSFGFGGQNASLLLSAQA